MSIFSRKQSVEIDYDKLADAIVKAQQKADTQTIKNAIIEAKEELDSTKPKRKKSKELIKVILEVLYVVIIIVCFIFSAVSFVYGIKLFIKFDINNFTWYYELSTIVGMILFPLILGVLCLSSYSEMKKEDDFDALSSMLANLTSLGALIVAIMAIR